MFLKTTVSKHRDAVLWATVISSVALTLPNINYGAFAQTATYSIANQLGVFMLEFGERLDLVLWETCHIYATCQAYRAEAEFQHSPISEKPRMLPY